MPSMLRKNHFKLGHIFIDRIKILINDGVVAFNFTNFSTCVYCIKVKKTKKNKESAWGLLIF